MNERKIEMKLERIKSRVAYEMNCQFIMNKSLGECLAMLACFVVLIAFFYVALITGIQVD